MTIVAFTFSIYCYSQKLEMTLEVEPCVNASTENRVNFIIENQTDADYWIKPNFLTFSFRVYSKDGDTISRKTTKHLNQVSNSEYIKVGKNSKVEIEWVSDFFENYQFTLNEKYYLVSGYELTHLTRKEKKKFLKSGLRLAPYKFSGKSNLFEVCDL